MKSSGPIFDSVVDFFTEEGWSFSQIDDEPVLTLIFQGDNGTWNCFIQVKEEAGQCIYYSSYPQKVSVERRPAVSEFLTRANYGLPVGNFEMDLDDGEVRYKTAIDVTDDRLSRALFSNLGSANVTNFNRYLPGINAIIAGQKTVAEAVADIEQ